MVQTILISIFSDPEIKLGITQLGLVTNNTSMKCLTLAVVALRLEFNSPSIELALVFAPVIEAGEGPDEIGKKCEAVG